MYGYELENAHIKYLERLKNSSKRTADRPIDKLAYPGTTFQAPGAPTVARMPALTASGSAGQESISIARSASLGRFLHQLLRQALRFLECAHFPRKMRGCVLTLN